MGRYFEKCATKLALHKQSQQSAQECVGESEKMMALKNKGNERKANDTNINGQEQNRRTKVRKKNKEKIELAHNFNFISMR